jgi:hypothetical protein
LGIVYGGGINTRATQQRDSGETSVVRGVFVQAGSRSENVEEDRMRLEKEEGQ